MSLDASPLVSIRNLSFKRGDRAIFENISLDVARGKVTAIMGPSGCGKTTTLRFIGGQLHPDEGQVLVDGQNVPDMSRKELFMARAKMGMLFQSGALFSDLSVYENVAFPLRAHTHLPENLIR
ncbi:MAG TPA: ATP-binding cassette domain-containing protein, partial [Agitococcus sp.]|nr:ATP-binding cassette domain-containing protein [Agitococcus sp.]